MCENLIECKNLSCKYGSYLATDNVNFSIAKGDYLCIVGANGSGKSTIVKTILGLHKEYSGSIEKAKDCRLGYLPQQRAVQKDFPADVFEVVLSGTLAAKNFFSFYTKADKNFAWQNIEKLGIKDLAKKSFRDLSGGQQQRVLLARALCAASDLLVLDEPVTGLDPNVTDELYTIIHNLNVIDKIAIIMVSHDIHRAVTQASHILHLNKASLFFGTSKDYCQTELYNQMKNVETCSTHCNCDCDQTCNASHIIMNHHHHHVDGGIK
ncbi:MAG: metal ABC transporter ATP-binding protein [Treponemataceae bacterium]|nr:metal ABC transporter ATP-binding protein [Treponemataceae bacterium]